MLLNKGGSLDASLMLNAKAMGALTLSEKPNFSNWSGARLYISGISPPNASADSKIPGNDSTMVFKALA